MFWSCFEKIRMESIGNVTDRGNYYRIVTIRNGYV